MKGFLVKDFLILRNQWRTLVIILLCALFMSFTFEPTVVVSYMTLLSGLQALSTITYDELNRGFGFLMTLPASRKEYVWEKYLLSVIWTLFCMVLGVIFCLVITVTTNNSTLSAVISDIPAVCIVILCMVSLILSVMIPIRLKYGAEKGRIVMYFMFALTGAAVFLLMKFTGITPEIIGEKLSRVSGTLIASVVAISIIIMLAISLKISERIMEKKEF